VLADDRRALKEWAYVALSRAREQSHVYTTANQFEPDAPPRRPEPADPVDRLAGALSVSAAERLALDAATTRPEPAERGTLAAQSHQLREQKLAVEKEHLNTTRQLHQTGRALARLGLVGRTLHGRTLRDELSQHDRKLVRLDRELERLDHQIRLTRERALELAPRLRPERGLSRGRGIGRGLDRGIEL
jgi:hypothetical protein